MSEQLQPLLEVRFKESEFILGRTSAQITDGQFGMKLHQDGGFVVVTREEDGETCDVPMSNVRWLRRERAKKPAAKK